MRLWQVEGGEHPGGRVESADVSEAYLDALTAELRGHEIAGAAWDSGNGATGPIVERLLARLGPSHRALFSAVDGTFPNHHPDPSVAANLQPLAQAVVDDALALGIAFDGDGDRVGLVDSAARSSGPTSSCCCSAATCSPSGRAARSSAT